MKLGKVILFLSLGFLVTACGVSKKQYSLLQTELDAERKNVAKYSAELSDHLNQIAALNGKLETCNSALKLKEDQMNDLRSQLTDVKTQRDKQFNQVGDLTVLSQSANENIKETLQQLEKKDRYIGLLQKAKTKADSINLALAVNLKSQLADGIEDKDVEIKVDKTVVFINLSDKMLYQSGSADITSKAHVVLSKIAKIVESRPNFEIMVEGYTDNVPMNSSCMKDNWDLSVKRATSVVRVLQSSYGIDPNRLIAAGRGEYNMLASNNTAEGRSMNRRTRIIILPKIDQFYDLLNPNNVPE